MTQLLSKYIKNDVETKNLLGELEQIINEESGTKSNNPADREYWRKAPMGFPAWFDEKTQQVIAFILSLFCLAVAIFS